MTAASRGRRGRNPRVGVLDLGRISVTGLVSTLILTLRGDLPASVAARGHVDDFWRRVPSKCSILRFSGTFPSDDQVFSS